MIYNLVAVPDDYSLYEKHCWIIRGIGGYVLEPGFGVRSLCIDMTPVQRINVLIVLHSSSVLGRRLRFCI